MNSPFKFPRRVRIHGGECGAVARALHHEAQKDALMSYEQTLVTSEKAVLRQAEPGNVSGSTIERKQMSTKTTLKRIALVAVSALGFGLMTSVAPASAAVASGFSLTNSSITVVGTGTTGAVVGITVTNTTTALTGLSAGETLTATVVGVPTGTAATAKTLAANAADLTFQEIKMAAALNNDWDFATGGSSTNESIGSGATLESTTDGAIGSNNTCHTRRGPTGDKSAATLTAQTSAKSCTYFLEIVGGSSFLDQGVYTIQLDLTNVAGATIQRSTMKVDFVSLAADSGAKLTASAVGGYYLTDVPSLANQTDTYNWSATLTNRDGGALRTAAGGAPTLSAQIVDSTPTTPDTDILTAEDTGGAGLDDYNDLTPVDGIYALYAGAAVGTTKGAATITVRYGLASATAALTIYPARSAVAANTKATLTATGTSSADKVAKTGAALTWTVPTSTTSGSLKVVAYDNAGTPAIQPNVPLVVTTTWDGNYGAANVTPVDADEVTVYTDATGAITLTFENKTPQNGASVEFSIAGFTSAGDFTGTITWATPVVDAVSPVSPDAGFKAKYKSTNSITFAVTDQFGNAMANHELQPSLSTGSANYSATPIATVKTDSSGLVTFTWTDAAATATVTSDALTMTSVANKAKSGSLTVTYVTTVPVVGSLKGYYEYADATNFTTLVPATPIYTTVGGTTKLDINQDRNTDFAVTVLTGTTDDLITFRYVATTDGTTAATGVPVTITAGDGGFILSSTNKPVTSRTIISAATTGNVTFTAGATKSGNISFTIAAGTASATATLAIAAPANTAGRFITISGAKSGTANGASVPVTITVTDRYGNVVPSVALAVNATGAGTLGGGVTTQTYTTDASGTYTFMATSNVAEGGAATYSVSTSTTGQFAAVAGKNSAGSAINADVAAGNATASHVITFAAGRNPAEVAAEAASDAAAEAIDAANAATDAANLAAEAADAATVAAEEARDAADAATAAVEELATQVATLMAALKAQITTLANTVAKIAKKVKA